jgi:hypothetical protein
MVTVQQVRILLSKHGECQPQSASDWNGPLALPLAVEKFYGEIGPVDVTFKDHGNPFFLPRLSGLWQFQAGYRWNSLTGDHILDWPEDWLVVADQGGDPFIFSASSETVLFAYHGEGTWDAGKMFPNLNVMAAVLATLGTIVSDAADSFTDDDFNIRPQHREGAAVRLADILESRSEAESVLGILGWGL